MSQPRYFHENDFNKWSLRDAFEDYLPKFNYDYQRTKDALVKDLHELSVSSLIFKSATKKANDLLQDLKKNNTSLKNLADQLKPCHSVVNVSHNNINTININTASTVLNKESVQKEHEEVDLEDSPFIDHTPLDSIRTKILRYRANAKYIHEPHKQDLLFHGIVDLTPSSSTKLREVIDDDEINILTSKLMKDEINKEHIHELKEFAFGVFHDKDNSQNLEKILKAAKLALVDQNDDDCQSKKQVLKMMKHCLRSHEDGKSSLLLKQGEMNYIVSFMGPLIKTLLQYNADKMKLIWGDQSLEVDKQEKQSVQKDDERRAQGKIPDAIIYLTNHDYPFVILEVSGPPNITNHNHFVGDKIKMAKHLKCILKSLRRTISSGDEGIYEEINVYGIQVYLNKMYIYSFSQPFRGVYVYREELSFALTRPFGLQKNFLPRLVKSMFIVKSLLESSATSIEKFIHSEDGDDASDDSRDTVFVSPKKQKTRE